jgi:tetratricopeptide (TPR) repeat protein
MKIFNKSGVVAAVLVAALVAVLAPHAAAQTGSISGQVLDINGKPWAGLTVQAVSDQGAKQEGKTDNDGKYSIPNLRPGIYTVTITAFPPPNDKQPPYTMAKVRVASGEDAKADANFKDIMAKQGAAAQEQVKKQAEEKERIEGLKAHVTAGDAIVAQERQAKTDLQKAPADQRDAAKQKLLDLSNQAVAEFQAAQKTLKEKDPNAALVWYKLGEAYDTANRNEEAAEAYQQAISLKSDVPGYYNNLGNVLARAGKIEEAKAAYTRSAELDPPNAATAWRNLGISLFNTDRKKDAIEPLQKSLQLDPKSAQAWFLLGASMVGAMEWKREGSELKPIIMPGTIEAYEKALELDPSGPWGAQAKDGLAGLQQLAPGIETKVNAKKKKS